MEVSGEMEGGERNALGQPFNGSCPSQKRMLIQLKFRTVCFVLFKVHFPEICTTAEPPIVKHFGTSHFIKEVVLCWRVKK